jgi:hypothetical protein
MSDRNKFEEMLELLVNEDRAAAESLFHELVVEKSRKIYENLLEDELDEEEVDEATDEEVDEASEDDLDEASEDDLDEATDEEVEEGFDLDEFEVEADPMDMGGDPADDMMGDIEADGDEADMGDEDEGDMEDRVVDLEDALDELKAEFEKMMGDDEGEGEDDMDMDMDGDDEEAEEESFAFEATDEEVDESEEETDESSKSAGETMREYVEKVSATMGDNGANTKSTVAGANNMGGTAANIAKGGESSTGGTAGGLANPATSEESAGNVNVPGGKASKSMKAQPKGHGAEKKGSGDNGANTKSTIGS